MEGEDTIRDTLGGKLTELAKLKLDLNLVRDRSPLQRPPAQEVGAGHQRPLPPAQEVGVGHQRPTDNCVEGNTLGDMEDSNSFDDLEDYDLPTASLPSQHASLGLTWHTMTQNTVPATVLERNHLTPVSEDDFKWD